MRNSTTMLKNSEKKVVKLDILHHLAKYTTHEFEKAYNKCTQYNGRKNIIPRNQ